MKVQRIVRSKYILHFIFITLMINMAALGLLIQGYMPFGPFGEPDPTMVFMPIVIDAFIVIFWFRDYVLLITDKVITRLGIIRVHSEDSVAVFDPLDYIHFNKIENLSAYAFNDLFDTVQEKYSVDGQVVTVEQKHMKEILFPIIEEFRDREYQKYLGARDTEEVKLIDGTFETSILPDVGPDNYDKLVHGVMPQDCREDGGNRLFGRRGARTTGNAVLVTPHGMVRQQGPDSICYCEILSWWGVDLYGFKLKVPRHKKTKATNGDDDDTLVNEIVNEIEKQENPEEWEIITLPGLPHYIFYGVLDHNPWFRPGDHAVLWGTEPTPEAVRALVEDNKDVTDFNELQKRPRWVFGFPATVEDINAKARIAYIKYNTDEDIEIIKRIGDSFGLAKQMEEKAIGKEEEVVVPVPVDESKQEVEG